MTKKQFRILVVVDVLLSLLLFCGGPFLDDQLPQILKDFLENQNKTMSAGLSLIMFIVVIITFIANIELVFFGRVARIVFTVGTVVLTIGTLCYGPVVQSAISNTLQQIVSILDGAIIALMYFSDVKYFFEKKDITNRFPADGNNGKDGHPSWKEVHAQDDGQNAMKRIYSAPMLAMVSNVQNYLKLNGIKSSITNQYLSSGAGELPPIETWPQLWVAEGDIERALDILDDAEKSVESESKKTWVCSKCRQEIEGQFSECWNCGATREEANR